MEFSGVKVIWFCVRWSTFDIKRRLFGTEISLHFPTFIIKFFLFLFFAQKLPPFLSIFFCFSFCFRFFIFGIEKGWYSFHQYVSHVRKLHTWHLPVVKYYHLNALFLLPLLLFDFLHLSNIYLVLWRIGIDFHSLAKKRGCMYVQGFKIDWFLSYRFI